MSKAVLISIRPKWVQKIANGEKTIEVRKNRPKLAPPFRCYIYCTQDKHLAFMQNQTGTNLIACMDVTAAIPVGGAIGNGKVIGEFTCKGFIPFSHGRPCFVTGTPEEIERMACLSREEIWEYAPHGNPIGWRITDLVIYNTPRELTEFRMPCPNDLYCEACAMYSNNGGICNNGALPLRRPPQSWCYVEAMKDE